MLLFGRDHAGASVAVKVDVRAYMWVRAPSCPPPDAFFEAVASRLEAAAAAYTNKKKRKRVGGGGGGDDDNNRAHPPVASVDGAAPTMFRRFHGYDDVSYPFVKVHLDVARAARDVRDALTAGPDGFELAEADIDFAAQACADMGVAPGAWVEACSVAAPTTSAAGDPAAASSTTAAGDEALRVARLALGDARSSEARVCEQVDDAYLAPTLAAVAPRPDVAGNAPLRVLSLDIETLTKDLGNGAVKFYDGGDAQARLVCAAACDMQLGADAPPPTRVVFALDPDMLPPPDAPPDAAASASRERAEPLADGVTVRWFADEAALMCALSAHVRARDPDFVTGWNTDGFDFEWLDAAARRLGIRNKFWEGFSRVFAEPGRYSDKGKVRVGGRCPPPLTPPRPALLLSIPFHPCLYFCHSLA